MKNIVFFNIDNDDKIFFEKEFGKAFNLKFFKHSLEDFVHITEDIKNANVISCFTTSELSSKILEKFSNLEMIALRCVGFNNVDIEYCKKNNIKVLNSKGYGNRTVAEFTFGLIFDVSRYVSKSYLDLVDNSKQKSNYTGIEIKGKTIGIIGLGAIGSEVAKIAHNLQMNVLGYDIYENENLKENYNVKYVSLDKLLSESDFISIHAPLTKENYHLIDEKKFALMKETAIVINTARGEIIDTNALYKALSFGTIKGAGLDVLECEDVTNDKNFKFDMDYLDKKSIKQILLNHEITKLDNAIVTPHIAYDTEEAKERIRQITTKNIYSFFAGNIQNNVY